jgi:[ribosomal protein S18]-alanine N-acetyltransferase
MTIRSFADNDVAAVHAIQLMCPHAAQWHRDDYSRLADDPYGMVLVAELASVEPSEAVGFAAFYRVIDEAELRNLAVQPTYQRQGIARALLREGTRKLGESGVRRIFLEVRASNHAALEFYTSLQFRLLSTRNDYYQNPVEDALVMALDIAPPSLITFQ